MSSIPFLSPKDVEGLPPMALRAIKVVDGALTGHHQSPHQGQSIEFNQHKEYSPGDDIRHVDWKIFGKSDRYYIKQFEDETNLRAYLLLDCSNSMFYPHNPELVQRESKWTYAATLALAIAYLLFRQRDSVGCMTFGEELQQLFPPQSKPSQLLHIANQLEEIRPQGKAHLQTVFKQLAELTSKKSVVLVFSDFFDDVDSFMPILQQLSVRGEDVVLFHILDPEELDFSFQEQTIFEDLENPSTSLTVHADSIRPYYLKELADYLEQMQRKCSEAGIEYRRINTQTPIENTVRHFLIERSFKRRSGP